MRTAALLILCLAPLWLGGGTGGAASAAWAEATADHAALASNAISLDKAVTMVEQRFHARVVKAEAQSDNGRTVYVMRLLDESGKVWTVRVDASSGSVQ
jgi:uncharacterized membrane protein YkoI